MAEKGRELTRGERRLPIGEISDEIYILHGLCQPNLTDDLDTKRVQTVSYHGF